VLKCWGVSFDMDDLVDPLQKPPPYGLVQAIQRIEVKGTLTRAGREVLQELSVRLEMAASCTWRC